LWAALTTHETAALAKRATAERGRGARSREAAAEAKRAKAERKSEIA
jgi:hypothetical protein